MSEIATPPGLDGLDPLLQHRSRLGAMVLLSGVDAINFAQLRKLLQETDGNLGAQLRKLEDARYISATKMFEERKPVTFYSMMPAGKSALRAHLKAMETIIRTARS